MGCGSSSGAAAGGSVGKVSWKNVKLTYFNGRGRGETSRLLLHYGGIKFEDNRVEQADWPELKPKTPFGSLPVLEVNGVTIGQSSAIARFIATDLGLAGRNNLEAAVIDSIVDTCADVTNAIASASGEKDEEKKKELMEKFWGETLSDKFSKLEKILKDNKGGDGFFVGPKMSWADIRFFDLSFTLYDLAPEGCNVKDEFPKLLALNQKVAKDPKIADWVAKRPASQF